MQIAIVGGGVFGTTTAHALRDRGHAITVFDPGPPHPLAESTDISKVVRMDYGADADYTALGEASLARWRSAPIFRDHFHETGVTFLSRGPMERGGFEYESYRMLTSRGHSLERLDAAAIAARFPAYRRGAYVDGYFNAQGGWAASGNVVAALAAALPVKRAAVDRIVDEGVIADGALARADLVIVCAGSWVPLLVPELRPALRAVGQPVFHLRPADPALFEASRFPVFGADISRTGYYGFPVDRDGIVKIANHGTGTVIEPGFQTPREVTQDQEEHLRAMLRDSFPSLADAPIVARRLCVYCDTADENFWIAKHPARDNLVVATGGSGHAFKFAPVIGEVIAAIALDEPHPLVAANSLRHKFRWRADETTPRGTEAARHHAD